MTAAAVVGVYIFAPESPEPAPAQVTAVADAIEKGRYLAAAGNCASCHTRNGGEAFAGGRPFRAPYAFLGVVHSSNLTPDPKTGIGLWTEAQFTRAMRSGRGARGEHLFPVFPYTAFTKLADADVKALFAYLKTVPAVDYTPPRNGFWFRQRWALSIWKMLFFKTGRFASDGNQSVEWNRGAYLVDALAHCSACHTPRNRFLAEREDLYLTGGVHADQSGDGEWRIWSAVNLTSAESGLDRWSVGDLKKYLKTGHNRWAGLFGPMNEVIVNGLSRLSDEDLAAMATYLKSVPANGESPRPTMSPEASGAGQKIYDKYCEECHLSSGRGSFMKAPPVARSAIVQAADPSSLINVILHGAEAGETDAVPFGAWEDMPEYKDELTDAEAAALANFLRTSWENRGGPVSERMVARQR